MGASNPHFRRGLLADTESKTVKSFSVPFFKFVLVENDFNVLSFLKGCCSNIDAGSLDVYLPPPSTTKLPVRFRPNAVVAAQRLLWSCIRPSQRL
jgi:hypothetical protein